MRKKIEDDLSWTHYNNLLQIIVQRVECSVSSTDWEASLRSWCFLVPGGPVWCVPFFCFGGEVPSIPTYMFRDFDLFPLWFLGVRPIYPSQNFCMLRMLDSKFNFLANCRTPYLFLGGRVFFCHMGITSHSAVGFCDAGHSVAPRGAGKEVWREAWMVQWKWQEPRCCSWNCYCRCYSYIS